jgi:hypothetical protein
LNPSITSLVQAQRQRSQTPTRIQCARPFTSMLLAIDVRERRVVEATVSPGVASVDTLPVVLDLSVDIPRNEKARASMAPPPVALPIMLCVRQPGFPSPCVPAPGHAPF